MVTLMHDYVANYADNIIPRYMFINIDEEAFIMLPGVKGFWAVPTGKSVPRPFVGPFFVTRTTQKLQLYF